MASSQQSRHSPATGLRPPRRPGEPSADPERRDGRAHRLHARRELADRALAEPGLELLRHLRPRFALCLAGSNFVGAVLVYVFLAYVAPTPVVADAQRVSEVNLIGFVAVLLVSMPLGTFVAFAVGRPTREWLSADRLPDERERRLTLQEPLRQAGAEAVIWVIVALVFAAVNAPYSLALGAQAGATIMFGGVATCALSYLLYERTMRPITARALAGGAPDHAVVPGVTTRLVLTWAFGTAVVIMGIAEIGSDVLIGIPATREKIAFTVLYLSLVGLGVGLATIFVAARSVADPLESVRSALAEVEAGNIDVEAPVYDGSEVGVLQAGFNRMVAGLREREQLRDLFGRHVGEDVARQAIERGLELGGEVRDVAVLFVDLMGSTTLAATRDPRTVVATLNAFFGAVVEAVSLHGGWVNKFEGDAALCVFGAPTAHPDAAGSALATARRLQARLRRELPDVRAGIGLSAGAVVAGNVGAAERFEYTVIGDPVNEAARLTELAKTAPEGIVASEAILARAGAAETPHWELGEERTLRGRTAATRLATPR